MSLQDEIDALREQVRAMMKVGLDTEAELIALRKDAEDAAYFRWRLEAIIPLFQEARDALTAISLTSARLHGVDLTLAARMDAAGTATRADFDAAVTACSTAGAQK